MHTLLNLLWNYTPILLNQTRGAIPPPPVEGSFSLLNGSGFSMLSGSSFALLEDEE